MPALTSQGFGLLGHLREVTLASGVSAQIDIDAVSAIDGTLDLLAAGAVAGGTQRNHAWVAPHTNWGLTPMPFQHLVVDAQTSGGLLPACAPKATDRLLRALARHGSSPARIGRMTGNSVGGEIVVT